jgi:hypothetical protein
MIANVLKINELDAFKIDNLKNPKPLLPMQNLRSFAAWQ